MSTEWQRARTKDQKAERIESILNAAGDVFEGTPYEEVTMQMIADKAGFTRSNLYRYFKTREEIFLNLFKHDVIQWIEDLTASFCRCRPMKIETFASKWAEVCLNQARLVRLTPLLTISLERNASEEQYREFKLGITERMADVISMIQQALPELDEGQIYTFFLLHNALVAGGWNMCSYNETQAKVLSEPELAHFKLDFEEFYTSTITTYLRGLTT